MHTRSVTCPYCNAKLQYRSSQAASKINCPGCHRKFYSTPSSASGRTKSQSDADNYYDVTFRGGKIFSLLIPSKHADRLHIGAIALLLLLILGGAVLLGSMLSRGSPSPAKKIMHTDVPTASLNSDSRSGYASDSAHLVSAAVLKNLVPVSTTTPFSYRLEEGVRFTYGIILHAHNGTRTYSIAGQLSFSIMAGAKPQEDEARHTGTAFAISSNGVFVTCAHVVKDAEEIHVVLGDESHVAEVVAFDRLKDVALLRISADGLPTLPLAESDEIQLAQPVRLVGYPLSGLLGKGVKISSGTITGGVEDLGVGKHRFQVDATFNSGNSGGPIIDDSGAVVGVASALFSGLRIDEVGIAVPVAEVRQLLSRLNVFSTAGTKRSALSGTELVQKVVKSVALVKVKRSESAINRFRVGYRWEQVKAPQTKQRRFVSELLPSLRLEVNRFPETAMGKFDMNHLGEITDYQGNIVLPFCSEELGKLVFEVLSGAAERSWDANDLGQIEMAPVSQRLKEESSLDRGSATLEGSDAEEQAAGERGETCNTVDKISYSIEEETPSIAKILARRKFSTLGEQKPPRMTLEGKRHLEFDKKLGLIRRASFKGVVEEHLRDDRHLKIPYTVEVKLLQIALP